MNAARTHHLAGLLGALVALSITFDASTAAADGAIFDQLDPGWCRTTDEPITLLQNEDARLDWQADGNLVIYAADGSFIWNSGDFGQGSQLCFQADGNLVIYDANGQWKWQSYTVNGDLSRLALDRCTLEVLDPQGNRTWDSRYRCEPIETAQVHKGWCRTTAEATTLLRTDDAYLSWQSDGNLALYDKHGFHQWNAGVPGANNQLCFQNDGNLVIYDGNGQARWDTVSQGGSGDRMVLDGCDVKLLGGPTMWTTGFSCAETYHDDIGTDWCRGTDKPGTLLQTKDARLVWQSDGHLVIYGQDGSYRWGTQTVGADNRLCFQTDGNLVIYDGHGQWQWQSGTVGGANSLLALDNCTVSISDGPGGQTLWSDAPACQGGAAVDRIGHDGGWCRKTSQPATLLQTPFARLDWQSDGNLVLYNQLDGVGKWWTGTHGQADRLCYQADGNFIIYDGAGTGIWHTDLYNSMGPTLSLDTCTLQIDGQPWSVTYDCSAGAQNTVEEHSESNSNGNNYFGMSYDFRIGYQTGANGFRRAYGEAEIAASVFNRWATLAEANAATLAVNGATSGDASLKLLGIALPVTLGTVEGEMLPPIVRDFLGGNLNIKAGPLHVKVQGSVTGTFGLRGQLSPTASGASVTVTPYIDLTANASGSASAACAGAGLHGYLNLLDLSVPFTASVDFVQRAVGLTADLVASFLSGRVWISWSACLASGTINLAQWDGFGPYNVDIVDTTIGF